MTTKEAAKILGYSASHLKHLCQNYAKGKTPYIKAEKIGRDWDIKEKDLIIVDKTSGH
jgi:hypothetical protein